MIANWDTISKYVAPLAGAWIEIMLVKVFHALLMVAPLAGAWIEICAKHFEMNENLSLPSRERGLKSIF